MSEFTTSRGKVVKFLSIAFLLDKFRESHRMPQPPQYEVKTMGGGVEKHPHDETTLETDADKEAWAEYQKELNAAQYKSTRDLFRLVLLRGIEIEMPTDDGWQREQELMGLTVPADPLALRLHYIETEVAPSVEDCEAIFAGVMRRSGVNEEVIAQVEDTFRGSVSGSAAAPDATPAGTVADLGALPPDPDGVPVAPAPVPVRPAGRRRKSVPDGVL